MMMGKYEAVNILLVEDDPGDQKLVRLSLQNQKIANDLHIYNNGNEALDFLQKTHNGSADSPRPDLILLDLNMPGMNGKEFLKRIKDDQELKSIPVVILTTSDSEKDIFESYNMHASGYVKKPIDLTEFKEVIKQIAEYWFVLCKKQTRMK